MEDAFDHAVRAPQRTARLAQIGADAAPAGTPAQFTAFVQADSARWAKLITERHITLQ
jgi:tripartite-type tricarboxylate transporter receptor subunit TctC